MYHLLRMPVEIYKYDYLGRSLENSVDPSGCVSKMNEPDLLANWNESFPGEFWKKSTNETKYYLTVCFTKSRLIFFKPFIHAVQSMNFDQFRSRKIPENIRFARWSFRWFNSSPHRGGDHGIFGSGGRRVSESPVGNSEFHKGGEKKVDELKWISMLVLWLELW